MVNCIYALSYILKTIITILVSLTRSQTCLSPENQHVHSKPVSVEGNHLPVLVMEGPEDDGGQPGVEEDGSVVAALQVDELGQIT